MYPIKFEFLSLLVNSAQSNTFRLSLEPTWIDTLLSGLYHCIFSNKLNLFEATCFTIVKKSIIAINFQAALFMSGSILFCNRGFRQLTFFSSSFFSPSSFSSFFSSDSSSDFLSFFFCFLSPEGSTFFAAGAGTAAAWLWPWPLPPLKIRTLKNHHHRN